MSEIDDLPVPDLGKKVRTGLVWSFINNGIGRGGSTFMGIVLAHLLAPKDFGVFAVALVVYTGILSMNELGVSLAVVRWSGDVQRIAPTVTTISVVSSSFLYGVCYLTSPWLADALGAPTATGVIRVLCLGVVVDGIVAVPAAWLQREFRQDRRTVVDQANFVVGAAVTILLATQGHGAWSLAWGRLAGNLVAIVLTIALSGHRYRFGFARSEIGPLLRFGSPLAGASLLVFGVLNVDYIVIGMFLGPVSLGIYVLAFNLSSWPVNLLSATVRNVSMAAFARQQHDPAEMRASFVDALKWLFTATVPVCALLISLARPAIGFVYGSKWLASASVLSFLAVLGGCRVAFELAYDYLVARGKSSSCFTVQAVWLCALIPTLAFAAHSHGIRAVGMGHVVVAIVVVCPAFLLALTRTGIDKRAIGRVLRLPLCGGVVAGVASYYASHQVHGDLLQLIVGGFTGIIAYLPFTLPVLRSLRNAAPADTLEVSPT